MLFFLLNKILSIFTEILTNINVKALHRTVKDIQIPNLKLKNYDPLKKHEKNKTK